MSFWTRPEIELVMNISAGDPRRISVSTNWTYYLTRLERCEAFAAWDDFRPDEGGRYLAGTIDQGDYNYLHLRTKLAESAQEQFEEEKKLLPPKTTSLSDYRPEPGERDTLFAASADEPYWLIAQTDSRSWLRWLEANPYAICVEEIQYAAQDVDGETLFLRSYRVPRSLLTIRQRRPQLSDEQRAARADRMRSLRPSN